MYTPNGIIGCNDKSPRLFLWTPRQAGANFEFSPTMKSLEPYRDDINVMSGLAQVTGRALGDGPGDHARATATWLTGVHPYKTGGADYKLGISADQIAAQEFGKQTQLASLELALEQPALAGNCDSGYTCAYMSMSWRSETSPLPGEVNPRMVFERLFGDGETTEPTARMARLESQKSVLDYVTSSLTRLQGSLGAGDKRKLDEYLAAVRDIERRIRARRRTERHDEVAAHGAAELDPGRLRGVLQADDGPAGHRLADRHDAGRVVHDGTRRQQPRVPRNRHLRRPSLDFAPPAGSPSASRSSSRSTRCTRSCSRTWWTS